jgi:hypothetical protein
MCRSALILWSTGPASSASGLWVGSDSLHRAQLQGPHPAGISKDGEVRLRDAEQHRGQCGVRIVALIIEMTLGNRGGRSMGRFLGHRQVVIAVARSTRVWGSRCYWRVLRFSGALLDGAAGSSTRPRRLLS